MKKILVLIFFIKLNMMYSQEPYSPTQVLAPRYFLYRTSDNKKGGVVSEYDLRVNTNYLYSLDNLFWKVNGNNTLSHLSIGLLSKQDLIFKTNNLERFRLNSDGILSFNNIYNNLNYINLPLFVFNNSMNVDKSKGELTMGMLSDIQKVQGESMGYRKVQNDYTIDSYTNDGFSYPKDRVLSIQNVNQMNITIYIPSAASSKNRVLTFKRMIGDEEYIEFSDFGNQDNRVTIIPIQNPTSKNGNIEQHDGNFSTNLILNAIGTYGSTITIISNGSEWEIIGH